MIKTEHTHNGGVIDWRAYDTLDPTITLGEGETDAEAREAAALKLRDMANEDRLDLLANHRRHTRLAEALLKDAQHAATPLVINARVAAAGVYAQLATAAALAASARIAGVS